MIKALAGNKGPISDEQREGIMNRRVNFRKNMKNDSKKHGSEEKIRTNSILKRGKFGSGTVLKTKSLEAIMPQNERDLREEQSCENHHINMAIKADYLKHCEQLKSCPTKKFEDRSFLPTISSLSHLQSETGLCGVPLKEIKWKRVSELFDGRSYTLWSSTSHSPGVRAASQLCPEYLIKGLNTLRTNRMMMRNLFETQMANPEGIYFVKIFHNDVWKYELIDDYIPVVEKEREKGTSYKPLLSLGEISRSMREPVEIWMYLLEKAYAKYYGSYQAITDSGNVFDFLCEMTGYDYSYYNAANEAVNWKSLFKEPEVVALGEFPNKSFETIAPSKGYSERISFLSQDKKQRNTIWPADVSKFFTGVFTWGERHYSYWGYCNLNNRAQSRVQVRSFTLAKAMNCCVSIYQQDRRLLHQPSHSYIWVRAILVEKEFNGGFRWIDGDYSDLKSMKMENSLGAGEYHILLIPEWEGHTEQMQLSIVLKAEKPVRLEKVDYEEGIIEEACADLAQRFGRLNQLNQYVCSYNCVHEHLGLIIENVNNEKRKDAIKIKRSVMNLQASLPIEPWNKEFTDRQLETEIKPLRHFTVVLMMKGGVDYNFFLNFSFKARE